MLVSDLLHSCAHERVAAAAVASIGGPLAERLQVEADENGMTVGTLAAGIVQRFAREASERDWRHLAEVVRGKDVPVLSGLEMILSRRGETVRPPVLPTAVIAATRPQGLELAR